MGQNRRGVVEDSARVHGNGARVGRQHGAGRQEESVRAREGRPRLRIHADPRAARAVPRRRDDHQQHRRAQRGGVHAAGNRRRSLPIERRVPHAVASEADRGQRRARRHVARSAVREAVRPGHADSVDAALDRERRSGGRLHLRLFLHLHRHDQLGVADAAAPDDPRSARRVRSAVRRRRDARGARRKPEGGPQHPRLDQRSGVAVEAAAGRERPAPARRVRRERARDRAPHPARRGAQRQRRAARDAGSANRRS